MKRALIVTAALLLSQTAFAFGYSPPPFIQYYRQTAMIPAAAVNNQRQLRNAKPQVDTQKSDAKPGVFRSIFRFLFKGELE